MVSMRKREISEFLASFLLAFVGLGMLVPVNVDHAFSGNLFNVLFGLTVAFDIIIFNTISGAQFNPSVTVSMYLLHRQSGHSVLPFIISQFLGWAAGTACIYMVFWNQLAAYTVSGAGNAVNLFFCNSPDVWTGAWLEFFLAAMLLILILACLDKRIINNPGRALFPFVIGAYITLVAAFGGGYSGAAINPARDLAPRIVALIYGLIRGYDVSSCFGNGMFLVYQIFPTLGAIAGAFCYEKVIAKLLPENHTHHYVHTQGK